MRSIPSLVAAIVLLASVPSAADARTPPPPQPSAPQSSIGVLAKTHNLDLGDGSMGMRIMVPTELVGITGQTVAAVLWFYDASGAPIRSAVDGWGDATNHLRIISRDVSPASARQPYNFDFQVPYCGFPRRSGGRYQVEARAVLVQRAGNGRIVLASRSTTFFVE